MWSLNRISQTAYTCHLTDTTDNGRDSNALGWCEGLKGISPAGALHIPRSGTPLTRFRTEYSARTLRHSSRIQSAPETGDFPFTLRSTDFAVSSMGS